MQDDVHHMKPELTPSAHHTVLWTAPHAGSSMVISWQCGFNAGQPFHLSTTSACRTSNLHNWPGRNVSLVTMRPASHSAQPLVRLPHSLHLLRCYRQLPRSSPPHLHSVYCH